MPLNTVNLQFLNHNSQRAYPLAEHVSATDLTGSIRIPNDLLVELYLPVSTVLDTLPDRFYIQSLTVLGGGITLVIGYDDGSDSPPVAATTTIAIASFVENSRFALVGVNDFDDTVGTVVLGRIDGLVNLPGGEYRFAPEATLLDPDAIRPMIRGVSSLSVEQSGQRGPRLQEHIVLEAGANIRLSTAIVSGQLPRIRIDAIPDPALADCECTEQRPPCIRTINDIPGDARQNFTMLGDRCLTLAPTLNGLLLSDTCCQPCCGATELEEVFRVIKGLEGMGSSLNARAGALESRLAQFEAVVLASRIGSGCGPDEPLSEVVG